jgi:hypothetical protein
LNDLFESIAQEIRHEYQRGRRQVELAAELNVHPRTIGHIIWGERRIGTKTLSAILEANPPWLHHILPQTWVELAGWVTGSNGPGGERSVPLGMGRTHV